MRRFASVGAMAIAIGCDAAPSADACETVEAAAVVELELDGQPRCLGIRVEHGWVLTAQHCVQPLDEPPFVPTRLTVEGASVEQVVLRRAPAQSLGALTGSDLALLGTSIPDGPLAAIGTPGAPASCAVVRRRSTPIAAPQWAVDDTTIYTDATTRPGDSGGPLLDLGGAALGIASWRGAADGPAAYTRIDAHEDWLWSTVDE